MFLIILLRKKNKLKMIHIFVAKYIKFFYIIINISYGNLN